MVVGVHVARVGVLRMGEAQDSHQHEAPAAKAPVISGSRRTIAPASGRLLQGEGCTHAGMGMLLACLAIAELFLRLWLGQAWEGASSLSGRSASCRMSNLVT